MANKQWNNLMLLVGLYLVIRMISRYFENLTAPSEDGTKENKIYSLLINFMHYVLLGYFSAKYWIFIILYAIIVNVWQSGFNVKDLAKKGLIQVLSAKFAGLLVGFVLNHLSPMNISLWTIVKEIIGW